MLMSLHLSIASRLLLASPQAFSDLVASIGAEEAARAAVAAVAVTPGAQQSEQHNKSSGNAAGTVNVSNVLLLMCVFAHGVGMDAWMCFNILPDLGQ